jgi:predicted GNAT family acetyltransferase
MAVEDYMKLGEGDKDDAVTLLSREVENNMLMLYNISVFGLEPDETRLSGQYFGRRAGERLVAIGAMYDLGSMLFYAQSDRWLHGMGEHVVRNGISPHFIRGKRSQGVLLLSEIDGRLGDYNTYPSELMSLRNGALKDESSPSGSRPATMDDLEEIVDMAIEMEVEQFEGASLMRAVMRELLSLYVESGTAFVLEAGGRIVSKAEGRLAGGTGAQIGGVYTYPDERGKGFATDVVRAVCRRLFQEVPLIALDVSEDNTGAIDVYRRIGFEKKDESLIATRGSAS